MKIVLIFLWIEIQIKPSPFRTKIISINIWKKKGLYLELIFEAWTVSLTCNIFFSFQPIAAFNFCISELEKYLWCWNNYFDLWHDLLICILYLKWNELRLSVAHSTAIPLTNVKHLGMDCIRIFKMSHQKINNFLFFFRVLILNYDSFFLLDKIYLNTQIVYS